jgi:hypothetical protein
MGSRTVRTSPRLAWEVLVELYGDEETLAQRIDELKQSDVEVDAELLELVDKYLAG